MVEANTSRMQIIASEVPAGAVIIDCREFAANVLPLLVTACENLSATAGC